MGTIAPGTLYLIPTTLCNDRLDVSIPPRVLDVARTLDAFIVENVKSARKFLGLARTKKPLEGIEFMVLDVDTPDADIPGFLDSVLSGKDVGLLSEAGCPCVADPGSRIVALAHDMGVRVVPLTGPSSVVLSLMGSGLNGQSFCFHGYLPIDRGRRREKLLALEKAALSSGMTQIFIEAPHRNDALLSAVVETCRGSVRLCVAVDLTLPAERIVTRPVSAWRKARFEIGKRPAVFLLGA
jgi:16S rRNA (cytidine1402-2'-O)-methyltransferase